MTIDFVIRRDLFLEFDKQTGQYQLCDPVDGSFRFARTAVRVPNEEKWTVEQLQEVKVLPC